MLETQESGYMTGYEEGYETGFQTGFQVAYIKVLLLTIREKQTGKQPSADIDRFLEKLTKNIQTGQMEELRCYLRDYPHMPLKKLAEKVLKETEYIYLPY